MHYRHVLEFENNAELSAIRVQDGKVIVRVHSDSPGHVRHEVAQNHLFPLWCSRSEKDCIITADGTIKPVSRKIWEMLDQINRHGEYDLPGASEDAVQKTRKQINNILESVGLKYRIICNGTVLKPEFIDIVAGI